MRDNRSQIKDEKEVLRRRVLKARRRLPIEERVRLSEALGERLFGLLAWQEAGTVGLYASLPGEVVTDGMIERALAEGKRVALPRVVEEQGEDQQPIVALEWYEVRGFADLESGAYGVREPRSTLPVLDVKSFDLLLVPGVVFDPAGNRIGFGKGFYDRTLAGFDGQTVALAFPCQIVEQVPTEPWDQRVQKVIELEAEE
ncbi:MAG: 5-formyltetrahydrofolate cyclo-ligase [Ardenticatenaceae bacterium]